jgi:uncharacterized membrane protein
MTRSGFVIAGMIPLLLATPRKYWIVALIGWILLNVVFSKVSGEGDPPSCLRSVVVLVIGLPLILCVLVLTLPGNWEFFISGIQEFSNHYQQTCEGMNCWMLPPEPLWQNR